MVTATKFVFLMHPKEFKKEKTGTGRLTHLCLEDSELHVGIDFDEHPAVQRLINDPHYFPLLVYPGDSALNLSESELTASDLGGRRLLVLLLDGTWSCSRKMLRLSSTLHRLPRAMFNAGNASRFLIKQQPQVGCLSTLETTHEILTALESSGLDHYSDSSQLPDILSRMQEILIRCAADPNRVAYRHGAYSQPAERVVATGRRSRRRNTFFR